VAVQVGQRGQIQVNQVSVAVSGGLATGESNSNILRFANPLNLIIGQAVYLKTDDTLGLANSSISNTRSVLGILSDSLNPASVITSGYCKNISWNWARQQRIYLGLNGQLVNVPIAGAAYLLQIGFALTATEIEVRLSKPILLAI
jgi:hypothetical protein